MSDGLRSTILAPPAITCVGRSELHDDVIFESLTARHWPAGRFDFRTMTSTFFFVESLELHYLETTEARQRGAVRKSARQPVNTGVLNATHLSLTGVFFYLFVLM